MTVSEAMSGETGTVTITRDAGTYWLSDPRRSGQDDYPTIEEAKAAGDRLVEAAEQEQRSSLLRSAGLDEGEWTVRLEVIGPVFEKADGSSLWIQSDASAQWLLMDGDETVGAARTPGEAARLWTPAPAA